jgi:hypothetical protein
MDSPHTGNSVLQLGTITFKWRPLPIRMAWNGWDNFSDTNNCRAPVHNKQSTLYHECSCGSPALRPEQHELRWHPKIATAGTRETPGDRHQRQFPFSVDSGLCGEWFRIVECNPTCECPSCRNVVANCHCFCRIWRSERNESDFFED